MPFWPVFKPDPEGDFVLNVSPERPSFLPPGPAPTRRLTYAGRQRPLSLDLRPAVTEVRSPRDTTYVNGAAVTTVTRSPRPSAHRRSTSNNLLRYDVSPRSPRSGASSLSPAPRSPLIVQRRSPRIQVAEDRQYIEIPPADNRATTAPPDARGEFEDEFEEEYYSSEDRDERPRVTIAETNRRNRREREYRETARRRRDAGRAPPERDDYTEVVEPPRRHRPSRQTRSMRESASMPPAPAAPPAVPSTVSSRSQREGSSSASERRPQQSPRVTEVTRTREYRRTFERERSRPSRDRDEPPRSAPPTQPAHSRSASRHVRNGSDSGLSRPPTVIQRTRARTDASGFLKAPPSGIGGAPGSGPLLLEDASADRAKHAMEERVIFGNGGRRMKQYHYG